MWYLMESQEWERKILTYTYANLNTERYQLYALVNQLVQFGHLKRFLIFFLFFILSYGCRVT